MTDQIFYEKAELLLAGKLSDEETTAFYNYLKSNDKANNTFNLLRAEHDALERIAEREIKQKFAEWDTNPPPDFSKREFVKTNYTLWVSFFLGLLFFIGLMYYTFKEDTIIIETPIEQKENIDSIKFKKDSTEPSEIKNTSTNNGVLDTIESFTPNQKNNTPFIEKTKEQTTPQEEKQSPSESALIFALNDYVAPTDFGTTLRSENNLDVNSYTRAVEAFDKKQFTQALTLLEKTTLVKGNNYYYLMAHIYFNLKKFSEAKVLFEQVSTDSFFPKANENEWYLLLTYMALTPDFEKEFKELAIKIGDNKYSNYATKAKELLKKYESI